MRGGIKSKKNIVKLAIFAWISLAGIVGAGMAARWFGGITQSEETNEIFNAAAQLPPELLEAVVWQPDRPNLKRSMEPLTRVDVTSAWIRAWEQLSIVAQTGDTTGLEVYFSNSALEGLLASREQTRGNPVHQLGHTLRVDFYSQDGQVIGLTADEVNLVRSVEVGGTLGWTQNVESYEAVLLLEDGNWRIQHWVRREADRRWWTDPAPDGTRALIEEAAEDDAADSAGLAINGINYYPRDAPFAEFWPNYDPDVVAADLDRVADAGLDSVRIFLPFDGLGGRWTGEEDLAPVKDFLDQADARGLGVVVTLFDGRTDHRTDKWDSDAAHIEAVVPGLAGHPALLMWDLKNEPDRDIGANGVDVQLLYGWLGHVAHEVRLHDAETPMTVGWSTPEAALAAPIHTDVVSFHFYGPVDDLRQRAPQLIEHADGRPVILSEFGLPTWNSVFPGGHTEAEQADYTAQILRVAADTGLEGTMVWTLWDLAEAPPDAGALPWSSGPQINLGLLRADGSAKPVLDVVRPGADLDAVEGVGPLHRLNKTFWRLALVGAFGLFVLWVLGGRIKDRRSGKKTAPRQRQTVG